MWKQIVLIATIVLIVVGLSGCITSDELGTPFEDIEDIEDKFVGTWQTGSGISRSAITFFSDGTGSLASGSTTWIIKDGKLVVYWIEGIAFVYDYSFSDDNNILTLTDVSNGLTTIYTKQ